jgi:hypothetical protein
VHSTRTVRFTGMKNSPHPCFLSVHSQ